MQSVPVVWPADAVHDTVRAILTSPAYRRSLANTILDRFLLWFGEALDKLFKMMHEIPGGRRFAIGVAIALVVLLLLRLLVAAHARDGEGITFGARGSTSRREDPWRTAERLATDGDYEGAAHALYRGVLSSLQQGERVRLDPSYTSGDYARALRAIGSGALHPFRAFARRFDMAVYGRGACDAALYDDLRRLAEPLRQHARAA